MGIHPDFSSFDRRAADLDEARQSLWLWAEPIVIDRAVENYARVVDEAGTVALARKHCRQWRMALFDPPGAVAAAVDDLRRAADSLGLPSGRAEDTDDAILEELVDIVACRYRSSRNALRAASMVLVGATSRLGAARAPA